MDPLREDQGVFCGFNKLSYTSKEGYLCKTVF